MITATARKGIDMATSGTVTQARRVAVVAAVAATGFLSGWSALGVSEGIIFAIALAAGVAVPVLRGEPHACLPPGGRRSRDRH